MYVVQVLVAIGIVLATVLVAAGRGDGLAPAEARRRTALPTDRWLEPADLEAVRLGVGFRGYRMDEVDDLLSRVSTELADRDDRIAALQHVQREQAALDPAEVQQARLDPTVTGPRADTGG